MKLIPFDQHTVVTTIEVAPNQPYIVRVAGQVVAIVPTYRAACAARRKALKQLKGN